MELTQENLLKFERDFFAGEYKHLRFGQAASNLFYLFGNQASFLFYEEDIEKCRQILWNILKNPWY